MQTFMVLFSFLVLKSGNHCFFYHIAKISSGFLQNIALCVPQREESDVGLEKMKTLLVERILYLLLMQ